MGLFTLVAEVMYSDKTSAHLRHWDIITVLKGTLVESVGLLDGTGRISTCLLATGCYCKVM